ncbi:MAG: L-histidine N(alpha)-methyltransferase [Saprospiraceae bacterium]|nr:L-histidine N(alpha)-methyltransferase [Saprospiraceae bacterium]
MTFKQQFLKDVIHGLSQSPKKLSSKYFYDKRGSDLFVDIMQLPEYYLTDSEREIFSRKTDQLIDALQIVEDQFFELIELGAGDGSKTIYLIKELCDREYNFKYIPVDISKKALISLKEAYEKEVPSLVMEYRHGDYFEILEDLAASGTPKVVLFLGSTLGNMDDDKASQFIYDLGSSLSQGDKLLLGLDLIKDRSIVLPAYNDDAGVTKEFNLNLLRRINRELGADFDLEKFDHRPHYDEETGIAKSHLISLEDQVVYVAEADRTFEFEEGELILTEVSRKYDDRILSRILAPTDFKIVDKIMDSRAYFADYILERSTS